MKLSKYTEIMGLQFLFLIGITVTAGAIALLLNFRILGSFFVLGILFSMIYASITIYKSETKHKLLTSILINISFIVIVFLLIFINGKFYDLSWDGQWYHQEAIIKLQEGWNPIYDKPLNETPFGSGIWINHYTKGPWYFSASVYDLFGNIEYGKVANIILIAASFLLTYSLMLKLKISKFWSGIVAILAALNPVAANQIFSYYVDGQLASLFLIVLVLFISNQISYSRTKNLVIIFSLILMINIKFTALVYALIICTLPIIIELYDLVFVQKVYSVKRLFYLVLKKKILYSIILGFIFGVVIVGASSYIGNTIHNKNPFYPISGEGKVDIMTTNTPISLKDKLPIEQFYLSIFSESMNSITDDLKIKFPLRITTAEWDVIWAEDARIGGFGPLFGAIFILTSAGILLWYRSFKDKIGLLVFLLISLSVMVNPEPWWARYIPQLWLIPILFVVLLIRDRLNIKKKIFASLISLVVLCNILVIGKSYVEHISSNNQLLKHQLETLRDYSQNNEVNVAFKDFNSNRIRLKMNGIKFTQQKKVSCDTPMNLQFSQAQICISNPELYNKIKSSFE